VVRELSGVSLQLALVLPQLAAILGNLPPAVGAAVFPQLSEILADLPPVVPQLLPVVRAIVAIPAIIMGKALPRKGQSPGAKNRRESNGGAVLKIVHLRSFPYAPSMREHSLYRFKQQSRTKVAV